MLQRLGAVGVVGFLLLLGGLALIAWFYPIVALGLALVVAGLGMVVKSLVSSVLGAMGMGGML